MKFAFQLSLKNIKRKPFRTVGMAVLVMALSFTVFAGAFTIISLQKGLSSYQARLGADIVVVPASAAGHGLVDDILLQGITGNYYMSEKEYDKIVATEGVSAVTKQFFLTSAKASCCSTRVQIIGFDPETDFSILPWISENYTGSISDGDVVVGFNINVPANKQITFYGQNYRVAAQLEKTGTGLDSAVYTNMNTIKKMAKNASSLLETSPFQGVNISTAASAVLIKVAEDYNIGEVADDINIHITKVQATSVRSMISDIAVGLGGVSKIIGILVGAIWVMALVILIVVFSVLSNERKKEFAVLRVMGASQKMLSRIMGAEATLISAAGALIGIIIALFIVYPLSASIQNALELPFLIPGVWNILILCFAAFVLAVLAGLFTAFVSARKITKSEAGLLLREDA